jgi:hypothetical protein
MLFAKEIKEMHTGLMWENIKEKTAWLDQGLDGRIHF